MARTSVALALLLISLLVGSFAATTSADMADGELPQEGDATPRSLPPESFGDVIGDESAVSPGASAPVGSTKDGDFPSEAGDHGGMGPGGDDAEPATDDGSTPTDDESSSGGSPTNAPTDDASPNGASTVKLTFVLATSFVIAVAVGLSAF